VKDIHAGYARRQEHAQAADIIVAVDGFREDPRDLQRQNPSQGSWPEGPARRCARHQSNPGRLQTGEMPSRVQFASHDQTHKQQQKPKARSD